MDQVLPSGKPSFWPQAVTVYSVSTDGRSAPRAACGRLAVTARTAAAAANLAAPCIFRALYVRGFGGVRLPRDWYCERWASGVQVTDFPMKTRHVRLVRRAVAALV